MIQLLRRLISSRLGVAFALAFLVLIALAFAAGDISNYQANGGGGGDSVASVGDEPISAAQLSQAATAALEDAKQREPRMSMKALISAGGLEQVLDQMLDRTALGEFGKNHGIVASDPLIDSEITKLAAFRGPDGQFSETAFRQALQQRGLSEKVVREDLGRGLVARQLMVPAETGAMIPRELALRYASLLREHRSGAIGLLPSASFAPQGPPSQADLQAYYAKNRDKFIRPERRVIRYATFGDTALKNVPAPTEAEIAARYGANKAQYAALETRRVTQLIVPTEAAAKAIADEVRGGKRLEQAAAEKGLSTGALMPLGRDALAGQASQAVAAAVFAAPIGAIAAPARSALGWHVMRVDGIERRAERTLDQARGELTTQLVEAKRRAALNDLSARMEEEFDGGGNLTEAAKELGLTLQSTPPVTADGQVYGQPGVTAPPLLARVISSAFAMERENQPQLAEVEAGKTFVIYDVAAITPSAPAPFADIRNELVMGLALERGSTAAKLVADKLVAQARKGADLGTLFTGLGRPVPPVDRVDMGRDQLAVYRDKVPPPLMLLFSMAKGTVKLLPAPNNRGWYIVALKEIVPGKADPKDPMLASALKELGQLAGREYTEQLTRAIRTEVGVKRDEPAIRALRTQLSGGS
jgi:peptidyl-prolyl cis-trans isomerase D